jgi:uncharacterized phage protein (TIGR01671 family)
MREIRFKFVLEDSTGEKVVSRPYTLTQLCGASDVDDMIYVDLDEKYGCDGNCTTEANQFCECGGTFGDYAIVDRLQYTGLKDKDGVEIYEGHIVKLCYGIPPTHDTLTIEYADNKIIAGISVSGWWMQNKRKNGCSSSLCKTYENDLEVIGNIHENENLLTT